MIPPRRYTSITVTFRDAKAGERKMALYSSGCLSVDVLPNSPAGPFRHQRARTHAREERRKYMHSSSMWRRHMMLVDVASRQRCPGGGGWPLRQRHRRQPEQWQPPPGRRQRHGRLGVGGRYGVGGRQGLRGAPPAPAPARRRPA